MLGNKFLSEPRRPNSLFKVWASGRDPNTVIPDGGDLQQYYVAAHGHTRRSAAPTAVKQIDDWWFRAYKIAPRNTRATTPPWPRTEKGSNLTTNGSILRNREDLHDSHLPRFLCGITCRAARTGDAAREGRPKDICASWNDNWNVHSPASVKIYVPHGLLLL